MVPDPTDKPSGGEFRKRQVFGKSILFRATVFSWASVMLVILFFAFSIYARALWIGLIGAFAALLASFILAKDLTRPLSALAEVAGKIGNGDLSARARVSPGDEVGEIASSFNRMADSLQRYQKGLAEMQKRLEDVAESTGDWVWELDKDVKFVYSSPAVKFILGYDPAEVIGKYFYDFFHPSDREKLKDLIISDIFLKKRVFRRFMSLNLTKYGNAVICESSGVPVTDKDGLVLGYRGATRDSTERKRAEEREKKLAGIAAAAEVDRKRVEEIQRAYEELKRTQIQLVQAEKLSGIGQLAAGVTHELNSPLTGLLTLLRTYRKNAETGSDQYNDLTVMLDAANHMASIVKSLTSFARESKGQFYEVDLNDVIDSTLSFSNYRFNEAKVKVIKDYDKNLMKIMGDKGELQQVVLNMINNACDAMEGGGEFTMRTRNSEDGEKKVIMEFVDTGTGIKEEYLTKIFDPFFTTKDPGKGTGLGLSVVHGIVRKHKGQIFVSNCPDKGAKFTIILPAVNNN